MSDSPTIRGTWVPGTDSYTVDGQEIERLRREHSIQLKAVPDPTPSYGVARCEPWTGGEIPTFRSEDDALTAARILSDWLDEPMRVLARRDGAQGEIARFTPLGRPDA